MARIIKEEEYNKKRDEILDVALSLVYSKGYEQMTIQDILDQLKISRGALYHYFDSKQALLEALIERLGKEAAQGLHPILQDPSLSAIQKFSRYFELSARWKTMQKELILTILPLWFSEDNAVIRQKMTMAALKETPRLLEPVIRQGIEEKVFTTGYPKQAAVIVTGVALSLADSIIELLLSQEIDQNTIQELETILEAYVDTIERILGAPSGSLKVFEADAFNEWVSKPTPEAAPDLSS